MPRDKSREWLDRLLSGEVPPPDGLKVLPVECPNEGQYFDYKAGALLGDKKADAAAVLRQYVSAFANADGGFVVLGYNQATQTWDGATAPGGGTLSEWATRVLVHLPQAVPRITATTVEGRGVLLVAVPRSRSLVPVVEDGALAYYLRIGDSTIAVPPYLLADLMLGRRTHSDLRLRLRFAQFQNEQYSSGDANVVARGLVLQLYIENMGLTHATDVRLGIVGWSVGPQTRPVSGILPQRIQAAAPPPLGLVQWRLHHAFALRQLYFKQEGPLNLGPFEEAQVATLPWILPQRPGEPTASRVVALGALYVLAKDEEPYWYQVRLEYDSSTQVGAELTDKHIRIAPLYEERPAVSIDMP